MAAVTSVKSFWAGKLVRLTCPVTDYSGALTNAPTVVLTITKAGTTPPTVVTPAVTNTGAAGVYYADVVLDTPGVWTLDWVSSGAVVNAEEDRLYVKARVA